jgi:hypothetical protein
MLELETRLMPLWKKLRSDRGRPWREMRHWRKMQHDTIEKTVPAELESEEKNKSYLCGPHGAKNPHWNWKRESCHSLDEKEFDSGGTWNKVNVRKKMRHDSIEKPVQAELELHEKSQSYPCGPHGHKIQNPLLEITTESFPFLDKGESDRAGTWNKVNIMKKMPHVSIDKPVQADLE